MMKSVGKLYLQFGCGHNSPTDFLNFDSSLTLRFERLPMLGKVFSKNPRRFTADVLYGDIVSGLPVPGNHFRGIYCSHVLEHMHLDDLRSALRNCVSYLVPGGVFRLVLPDLEHICTVYLSSTNEEAASVFMQSLNMRIVSVGRGRDRWRWRYYATMLMGNSRHLWMWDYKSLAKELKFAGFTNIRRARFGDSCDPTFNQAESPQRWENALGIECRKPMGS